MKKSISFILTIIFFLSFDLNAQFAVGPPVSITNGIDAFGYRSPKLTVDVNGDLLVFWMRTGSSEKFFFSRNDGSGFTSPIEIPLLGHNPNLWSGSLGPNMAAGGGHIYISFEVYGEAIYIIHSGDGGLNWDAPVAAFTPPAGRRATIPNIAVDIYGQPYVIYVNTDISEEDAHYGLVKSTDYGVTFNEEVVVNDQSLGSEVCECCNGHVAVAPNGDVFVAYRNNFDNLRDNWLSRSTDGGISFTSHFDMDQSDWTANVCPSNGPHFLIQENRVVTTFYSSASGWEAGNYFSSLNLDSELISNTTQVPLGDASSFSQNRPRIAGIGDTLAIVFQENYNGSNDIVMSLSTTGVSGLSNNSFYLTNAPNTQQYPSIAYTNSSFHVVYEDLVSKTVIYQEVGALGTGVLEELVHEAQIYPQPCDQFLKIELLPSFQNSNVIVKDIQGKVFSRKVMNDGFLDTSDLPNGMFILSIKNDNYYLNQKFAVSH